jgi:putative tryptophan/tyrosine transport system substrate-binding protein
MLDIRRRDFITLLGGAAAAWPLAARAQQATKLRRIGVLQALAADDAESSRRFTAFVQGLQELGWAEGRNMRIDVRWGAGDAGRIRDYAAELVALAPDVIFVIGAGSLVPLQQATRTVPIVFAVVSDPVGAGFVESLARPGGNVTGFGFFEFSTGGKWVELLKEMAPGVTRMAVIRDPTQPAGVGYLTAVRSLAPLLGVEVSVIDVRDPGEIERPVSSFARSDNGGLIVTPSGVTIVHRKLIIALAARYKLPTVYWERFYLTDGGLISYGPDGSDLCRRAASYVDRILKGEKPADLPVQAATKFELAINLKTAKALGLEVPPTLLARADEVIE